MHFRTSSTFALLAAALTLGAAAEVGAQQIPRGGKEPAPCVCDTVRITRVDTVTQFRRDTIRVTQYDTVRVEPVPVIVPPITSGFYLGAGGGVTFPVSDLENYDMGWNVTGVIGYDFPNSPFGLRLDASYDQFAETDNLAGLSADPTPWTFNGDVKFRLPFGAGRNHMLYALGGATWAYYKDLVFGQEVNVPITTVAGATAAGLETESLDNWTSDWGWNAGGGIAFGFGRRFNLFVESRYIRYNGGGTVPVIAGLNWYLGG